MPDGQKGAKGGTRTPTGVTPPDPKSSSVDSYFRAFERKRAVAVLEETSDLPIIYRLPRPAPFFEN